MIFKKNINASRRGLLLTLALASSIPASARWEDDYGTVPGFRLARDTTGYHFPTAIAFVPNPGKDPKDPLYFVAELRGVIKVVTNDRTVYTFAKDFARMDVRQELPHVLGEMGMAGICLEPENGYVFVSFAYEESDGIFRNAIMRFETKPGVFSIQPTGQKRLSPMLDGFMSTVSHQIGPMVIHDGMLLVSVGDGHAPRDARKLDSPNGKLLRMTFDGLPAPGNPFFGDGDPVRARSYIWAYGFRNPFSLEIAHGRVFVADNGPAIDRFMEVRAGDDGLFTGEDASIATNALFVWTPSVSPVQMDFDSGALGRIGFPEAWQSCFFVSLSGGPTDPPGPSETTRAIVALDFDGERGRLAAPPRTLMRYIGSEVQCLVGLAIGPDGLYVVPLFADSDGVTGILRLDFSADDEHPNRLELFPTTARLMNQYMCYDCHVIDGDGSSHVGPAINRVLLGEQLMERLGSPEYEKQSRDIDRLKEEPFISYRRVREAIRDGEGPGKVHLWLKHRLVDPRFDQAAIGMPNLGMSEEEAVQITDWLLEPSFGSKVASTRQAAKSAIARLYGRNAGIGYAGVGIGLLFGILLSMAWQRMRRGARPN